MSASLLAFIKGIRRNSRQLERLHGQILAAKPETCHLHTQICKSGVAPNGSRGFASLLQRMEVADGSLGLLPSIMGSHQARSIQRKAAGEGTSLPPSSPDHDSDFATRHASMSFEDVEVGKVYEGRVVNLANFGCFVNFGCEMDCLVHISQMSESFVRDVADVVSVGTDVRVKIINKDDDRRRISGTFRSSESQSSGREERY